MPSPFFNKVAGLRPAILLKTKTLLQVFCREFYEKSKNTYRSHPEDASVIFQESLIIASYCKILILRF